MPIKPRNPNNVRSSELGAAHEDHAHAHTDLTGVTSDQHHAEAHTVASHSDTTATGAELETLTDGSDADALHDHASAIHDDVAGEIAAITAKTTPVDADVALIEDSAATNAKKNLSWANIKATLKTYFDTLYAAAAEGVTNGDTHDHVGGDGAQIDHGGLAGLADDDHTQYLNDTRHNNAHSAARRERGTSDQTITRASFTVIDYNTSVREDDAGGDFTWDGVNFQWDINNAGWYEVSAAVYMELATTYERLVLQIRHNGTGVARNDQGGPGNAVNASTMIYASASDTIDFRIYQDNASTASKDLLADAQSFCTIKKVRE